MDFEQIRIFMNVASLKSFSAAAEKMFVSQPGVSVRIKSLEEELGVTLFDRSRSRDLKLTDAGRIFMDYAQALLNLEQEAREKLAGMDREATGLVRLGTSTVPGTYLLPPLLARFKKQFSGVEFSVTIRDTAIVLEGILDYFYDLGFVGQAREDERLTYIPLIEDELVFCTPPGLMQRGDYGDGVPLEECFSYHLLIREEGSATRSLLDKALQSKGHGAGSFREVTCFNSLEGIKQAVRNGLGVAFISRNSVNDLVKLEAVEIYPVAGLDLKRLLYMVFHRSRILGDAARRLIEFTRETYSIEQ